MASRFKKKGKFLGMGAAILGNSSSGMACSFVQPAIESTTNMKTNILVKTFVNLFMLDIPPFR
jgi:hypothetical protein